MRTAGVITVICVLAALARAQEADKNMKAFPPAEAGQVRYVIKLPKQADESALKVEVIVGRTELLDNVNKYFFTGKVEEVNIEGWGFTRYVVKDLGQLGSTMMAPPPDAPKVNRFVALRPECILRYNSRLPVVVYVPEGAEVKYRIWTAGDGKPADKG